MSDFWTACLEQIKNDTPRDVFQTWFADLTADVELEAGSITILAPSGAKLRTVRDSYGTTITQYVNRQAGKEMDIVWAVAQSKPQRPFAEHIEENKPDIAATGLLPNLTFENLVEGQANQMAFASALQVASSTHSVYNPLFIYGGVGLGKTHLMHAIGNRFLKNNPKAKVLCVSAQQYTQEFVDAMRLKNVNSERYTEAMRKFDARYRGIDMLLIDDIQSFRDREGTQTNFFLTFESMVPHGKQIVLTSDTYPKNLSEFQDRLLSRLTQGLIVMIEPPEFEMRVQILLQKAERNSKALSSRFWPTRAFIRCRSHLIQPRWLCATFSRRRLRLLPSTTSRKPLPSTTALNRATSSPSRARQISCAPVRSPCTCQRNSPTRACRRSAPCSEDATIRRSFTHTARS